MFRPEEPRKDNFYKQNYDSIINEINVWCNKKIILNGAEKLICVSAEDNASLAFYGDYTFEETKYNAAMEKYNKEIKIFDEASKRREIEELEKKIANETKQLEALRKL